MIKLPVHAGTDSVSCMVILWYFQEAEFPFTIAFNTCLRSLSTDFSMFINDKFYSNSKAKTLIQRGSSINKIRNYLLSKGVKDKYIKETIKNGYNSNTE